MARKKKQPATPPTINISLTEIDLVAKGTELANRMKQIASLKAQAAQEAARFRGLIDEQIELADTIASQILGGAEARNQATLKVGEDGALVVPEKPFSKVAADSGTFPEVSEADRERIESEKVTEGLKVPPAVADAIAKNGGEVDLSAGKAANFESLVDLSDAATRKKRGKKQPPKAPTSEPVTVTSKPSSCPDCGGKIVEVDSSGVFACADSEGLSCSWVCVVESQDTAAALGAIGA